MLAQLLGKIAFKWLNHFVLLFGAKLVSDGLLTSSQSTQLTGALMVAVPLLISAADEWDKHQAANKALLAQAQQSMAQQPAAKPAASTPEI